MTLNIFLLTYLLNHIETEQHFLLHCETLSHLRREVLREVENKISFFNQISEQEKFIDILSKEKVGHFVGYYVEKALYCRRVLIEKHKNLG